MSDDKFNRLESKLDLLDNRLDSIDKTLVAQHLTLEEHQRRSKASEDRIELMEEQLKPIVDHVSAFRLIGKAAIGTVAIIGTIVGILVGLKHLGVI